MGGSWSQGFRKYVSNSSNNVGISNVSFSTRSSIEKHWWRWWWTLSQKSWHLQAPVLCQSPRANESKIASQCFCRGWRPMAIIRVALPSDHKNYVPKFESKIGIFVKTTMFARNSLRKSFCPEDRELGHKMASKLRKVGSGKYFHDNVVSEDI